MAAQHTVDVLVWVRNPLGSLYSDGSETVRNDRFLIPYGSNGQN
jgi:hypothetical protein